MEDLWMINEGFMEDLRNVAPFSDRRRRHSSAIDVAGLVDGVSSTPEGGHQGDVARQGFATCGCAVDEEVQPALVIGWHTERCPGQPGLGNHASFRANPFASDADPGMLEDMGPVGGGRFGGRRARGLQTGQAVLRIRAGQARRRTGSSHRQGCAETPPQCEVHEGGSVRPGSLGMAVSHAPAWGPAWERSRARAAGTTQAATRAREKKFERRETRGAAIHVPGARVRVPQGWGVGEEGG